MLLHECGVHTPHRTLRPRFGCLGAPAFCSRQLGAGPRPPPRFLPADCCLLLVFPGQAPVLCRTPAPPCISSPPDLVETQKSCLMTWHAVSCSFSSPGGITHLQHRGSLPIVSLSCLHAPTLTQIYPPGPLSLVSPWCGRRPCWIQARFSILCIKDLTPAPCPAAQMPTLSQRLCFPSFFVSTQVWEAVPDSPTVKDTRSVFVQETENVVASFL